GGELGYGELNARANQLAHHLRALGVGPGRRVGLALERSPELVVGLLAILKAGGAYVPLDASLPAERLAFLLEDTQPVAIVTREEVADALPGSWAQLVCVDSDAASIARRPTDNPGCAVDAEAEAYVLFTSGSTGKPKGVQVPHRGILRLVLTPGFVNLSPDETLLQLAPLSFDASTFEIWGALLNGARLVLAPPEAPSAEALAALLERERVTTLWLTAGLFHQLVDTRLDAFAPVRQLLAGGDVLSAPHVARVMETHPGCQVINGYGPTENTTFTCCHPVPRGQDLRGGVPLGRPVRGTRVHVLNARMQPVPPGASGELYAAGDGLALGYLNQPALTAERFVPDPFSDVPGARLYRVGDLGRLRADGTLEFLGRADHQVKVRGFRIEPGEIEAAVRRHPSVLDAAVVVHVLAGEKSLVLYVALEEGAHWTMEGVRSFLSDKLPAYMVPAALVVLPELPLTANGKVDRRALPAPDGERPELGTAYQAPRTPTEALLAAVSTQVLGVETVGIDDSFFDLGGDSIRAIQFVARCRERGLHVSVAALLEKQTVRALADSLGESPAQVLAPEASAKSEPFALVSPEDRARLPEDVEDAYPLAALQAGMLFQSEFSQDSALYHDAFSFHLELDVDVEALRRVLRELTARHAVLRTSFELARHDVPLQRVHREVEPRLFVEDLSHLPRAEQDARITAWTERERTRPFTWNEAPLLRFAFHRRGARTAQFSVVFHHAILDGWSFASLLSELFPRYTAALRGDTRAAPPPHASFRDFVALEQQALTSEATRGYWREQLAAMPRARTPQRSGGASGPLGLHEVALSDGASEGLRALAKRAGVPLKSVLMAAHLRVRSVLDGTPDVVTGFVVNGRPEVEGGEQVLGLFLNSAPFHLRLEGGSWVELARQVFAREQALSPHRRYPMARLQQEAGGRPLFDVLFNFVHFHVSEGLSQLEGIRLVEPFEEASWLDLPLDTTFTVNTQTHAVELALRSHGHDWDAARLERVAGLYMRTLEAMAHQPDARYERAVLLSPDEQRQVLHAWSTGPRPEVPAVGTAALFEAQVERTPDAVAVAFGEETLSYRALDSRANQLAHALRELGVGPEMRVALALRRGFDMVAAVLGVLKAGGAYVPMDPSHPRDRLAYVLEDSEARVLVTQSPLLTGLPDTRLPSVCVDTLPWKAEAPSSRAPVSSEQLAYVLYTSGSTGRPKGVMVTHGGLVNYLHWSQRAYDAAAGSGAPLHSPLGFDLSITSLLTPLVAGGRVVLVPEGLAGEELGNVLRAGQDFGIVKLTPTQLSLLEAQLGDVDVAGRVRCFVVGGEALTVAAVAFWRERAPATRIINEYGPTETVVGCATFEVGPGTQVEDAVPIGRPIAHTRLYVLDAHGVPAPVGVAGELFIGGDGVARGYGGRPALTAERFVPDPFSTRPGARLYRTGDLARWREDGELEYLGRADDQVKVRGFRIELGEVEAVLAQHPALREVAVAVRGEGNERRLVGYVVAREEAPDTLELRRWLLTRLPEPLVPSAFLALEALPHTPNGKVDRRALPDVESSGGDARAAYVAPRTPVEERLAEVLAQVLGLPRVGRDDDFFLLGGHSLTATQAIIRLRDAFRIALPVRALFEAPTVARLAERVEEALLGSASNVREASVTRIPREGDLPLSFAQQRLWFMDQLEPGSASYNIPAALRVEGALDEAALARAFSALAERHESLRTVFRAEQGLPVQVILPAGDVPVSLVDLSGLAPAERDAQARRLTEAQARAPFDLARGPLMRVELLRLDARTHVLLVTLHHIISDGWSTGVLIREVAALYQAFASGQAVPLEPPRLQYVDYAAWQRRWMEGPALQEGLAYWRRALTGAPPLLELPTDRPRPAVRSYRGAMQPVALPRALSEEVRALALRTGTTPFMVLLGAFQVLLSRVSGQDDISVGSPVAGRTRPELEGLIGFFVNTLVLRTHVAEEERFVDLLARVREVALEATAHQEVPFDKLVEVLRPQRSLSHPPLFQVLFALQNAPAEALSLPGLVLREVATESQAAKFDLSLSLRDGADGFHGFFEYDTDLFEPGTVARLGDHLRTLLEGIAAEPESPLSRLSLGDAASVPPSVTTAAPVHPDVLTRFAAWVARTPDAAALVDGGRVLTYARLDHAASVLAQRLTGPAEHPVALLLERSAALVVAQLATLKAGRAFLPLDPHAPSARLATLLGGLGTTDVVTTSELAERLPPEARTHLLDADALDSLLSTDAPQGALPPPHAQEPAYVIFTSGTTGVPKGIRVHHAALANLVAWHLDALPLSPGERTTLMATPSFDASVLEIWPKLAAGATLVVVPDEVRATSTELARWLSDERIHLTFLPTAIAQRFFEEPLPAHAVLRHVGVGGDQLRQRPPSGAPYVLTNLYGPTEATVLVTAETVVSTDVEPGTPTIGRPIAGDRVHVLDAHLRPVPQGLTGELYLAGASVAQGYLGQPALTASRFLPDPFGPAGTRMYRSGDRGRLRADGRLECLGRVDFQVKVRGFRIELGEIEAVLGRHPALQDVVVTVDATGGDSRLVAHVVEREPVAPAQLRRWLLERLPEYMVPAAFVALERLPLTATGKVDRKALPPPGDAHVGGTDAHVAPVGPTEELITSLFAQVLRRERVGARDDFFDLGGHSLLATQLVSRLRGAFGVELPLKELFQAPTPAALARWVEAHRRDPSEASLPPPAPMPRDGRVPLSFAQQRLWFLDRLEPGSALYNLSHALRLTGEVDVDALGRAMVEVVRRHEVLRTTFPSEQGAPFQAVTDDVAPVLEHVVLDGPPEDREVAARERCVQETQRPFDLVRGPLLRAVLLTIAPGSHVLMVTMHHIVSDGWSVGVLVRELGALYAAFRSGAPSPLPPLPLQYADYALWQRRWLAAGGVLEAQLAYWRTQLEGAPRALELPTDRPRPPVQTHAGSSHALKWPQALAARVRAVSREEGVTPFMTLLAGFQALLSRYSGQDDVSVGTPIAGRTRQETEPLVGFFVNTLVLRTRLDGAPTFRQLLARVRDTTLGAYAHQDVPFEKVVDALQPERDLSRTPLFQVMFALQNNTQPAVALPGLEATALETDLSAARFDLTLTLAEADNALPGIIEYNTALFDAATVRRMESHLRGLLEAVLEDPERRPATVPLLSQAERRQVLGDWNAFPRDFGTASVPALFAERVARFPDHVALAFEQQRVSYRELDRRANHLAHRLRSLGVGPEARVGLCLDRSVEWVVAVLAVLKAGGAWVAMDPDLPRERLAFMVADSGARVLLVSPRVSDWPSTPGLTFLPLASDPTAVADAPPDADIGDDTLAYVIYTSGSTGRPKGTLLTHRGLRNTALAAVDAHGFHPGSRVLQFAALGFDASVCELFATLLAGGTLCLAPREALLPGPPLRAVLTEHAITAVTLTPSVLAQLEPDGLPALETVISAGEACTPEVARRWGTGRKLLNAYGPTEVTICASISGALKAGAITIGRPFPNVRVYVLDARGLPVPPGVAGELYVGGPGVARGYVGRQDLTAERFVPDAFGDLPGARLYRTGDVVRWSPEGELEYVGRADDQVKLRGFRIEPGEVEAVLRQHPALTDAVVMARADGGNRRLVAWVAGDAEQAQASALRTFLLERLPPYMVPAVFVVLPALPLTPSGKVDRKALPTPDASHLGVSSAYEAPRSELERTLAALWQEVLEVPRVGLHDGFFELGGNSLLLVQVHGRLKAALGVDVPLLTLFQHPNISALAAQLRQASEPQPTPTPAEDEARFDHRRALLQRQHGRRQGRDTDDTSDGSEDDLP
ncbi:amino acid adenylation domain-containing protein, partial [Corallococcus terminator]